MSQLNEFIDEGVAEIHHMVTKMDDVVERSPTDWCPGCLPFVLDLCIHVYMRVPRVSYFCLILVLLLS